MFEEEGKSRAVIIWEKIANHPCKTFMEIGRTR
jgi:hypothetical protein